MPLRIAFVAWNAEEAHTYLVRLAVDNADQVKRTEWNRGRVVLMDDTEIISVHPGTNMEGMRFDQYIIADNRHLQVMQFHGAILNELEYRCQHSIVPAEYRCQIYNIDEEDPNHGKA